jgi:hypothetical protein
MEPENFVEKLTKEMLEKFKYNFANQWEGKSSSLTLENYIRRTDMVDIIGGAFMWAGTPEGHDYWREVQSMFQSDEVSDDVDGKSIEELMPFFKASEWTALTKKAFKVHGPVKYSQLMEARHKTIGLFIMAMLGLEHWRGVPHRYNDIISRRHLQRPTSGQFYEKVKKSVTA